MRRLFKTHGVRECESLDGIWEFKTADNDKVYRMPVPSCWEQHPDFLKYRGHGTYTRKVEIKRGGNVRFEFKGVSHTADVYLDGQKLAHHYNAFTPFSFVARDVAAGVHELRVEVDNTFGEHSALHIPNDYYTYGGITRPAAMEYVGGVFIGNIRFTPSFDGKWHGKTVVSLSNPDGITGEVTLRIALADKVSEKTITLSGTDCDAEFDEVYGAKAWSHETPNLYSLKCELLRNVTVTDDLIERVGFRTVEVSGTDILVNGKKVFLMGFNRHEDYATVGCAVPLQLMVQDMEIMRKAGVNALRTCHYPNDERFLDLCDEYGILVWEENHARGLKLPDMQNPNFERQCEDCIREMLENHHNHPSIIIWGILNECASETPEGREMYKKQYAQIRTVDPSRPVTSATCRHFTDISLDLEDIASFNMYTGWYKDDDISDRNDREIEWIKASGGDNKPIIVSELGAAAIYGYRSPAREKWSEEFQADLLRVSLDIYMNDPRISGVFIWQFADCRVTEEGEWFATRARCRNNKGVLDEYRRPKLVFDTVREMFEKKAAQCS